MGDMVLALPACGLIKKYYPDCKISVLGRTYTKSIAMACAHIDGFVNIDDWKTMTPDEITQSLQAPGFDTVLHLYLDSITMSACKKATIPYRVGLMNKKVYWEYCNRLFFLRKKKSNLSEAQLNIKFLPSIGIQEFPPRNEVYRYYGFSKIQVLDEQYQKLLDPNKKNLILHPLSHKNAKEWGLHNFSSLLNTLDPAAWKIFITGSEKEKEALADWIHSHQQQVTDLTGRFNTDQLIAFIASCDGLIASSTGPLHIAAATGINTLGLYEDRWQKRGERWGPIGKNADFLQCTEGNMDTITPARVYERMQSWK